MLESFNVNGESLEVEFIERTQVKEGVTCDVYRFKDDDTRDLGIVEVLAGFKTPQQRVVQGESTIEGLVSGQGLLTITKPNGEVVVHDFSHLGVPAAAVNRGEVMQWHANGDVPLRFYEICTPPYQPGRFEDL